MASLKNYNVFQSDGIRSELADLQSNRARCWKGRRSQKGEYTGAGIRGITCITGITSITGTTVNTSILAAPEMASDVYLWY